jgi:hypothetical protein
MRAVPKAQISAALVAPVVFAVLKQTVVLVQLARAPVPAAKVPLAQGPQAQWHCSETPFVSPPQTSVLSLRALNQRPTMRPYGSENEFSK